MDELRLAFSDADLDALLSGGGEDEPPLAAGLLDEDAADDEEDDGELRALTRSLAAQYLDVLAVFVRQVFGGAPGAAASAARARAAVHNLLRLTEATHDEEMQAVLRDLDALLEPAEHRSRREREAFLRRLRELVLAFADCLAEADRARMRGLILHEDRALPLLDELGEVRGIGPRRLERLYCAGLFTVEALAEADPEEVALVTGIPRALAVEVVVATRDFAARERGAIVRELERRAREFARALPRIRQHDAELLALARQALLTLEQSLSELEESP